MTVLYTEEEASRFYRRSRAALLTSILLIAAALIGCIILCLLTTTGNARTMTVSAIILFTLAGWIAILLMNLIALPSHAESRHMKTALQTETALCEGRLELSPVRFRIPQSVTVRKVILVDDAEERHSFHVLDRKAALLPPSGSCVRVQAAHQFITAFEVTHESR